MGNKIKRKRVTEVRERIEARIRHDMTYIPRLAELAKMFPYSLTGPRKKIEWITSPRTNE